MRQHIIPLIAFALFGASAGATSLTLTTEDAPPFNFSNDGGKTITGIATDMVNEVLKRTGIQATTKLYPWERAYKMGQDEKDTCVFATTRTEAREALFKWVGPLSPNDWVLFAKADSKITLSKLDDAKPYKIGGYQGDAVELFLKEKGFKMEETIVDPQNAKKLEAGRIDLWATGSQAGPFVAAKEGVKIKPVLNFKQTQLYLACNKGTDDDTIAKMNAAIKAMEQDGTREKIIKKYQ